MVRVRVKQVNVKMSVPCDRSMFRVWVKQVNVKMSVPCDRSMVHVGGLSLLMLKCRYHVAVSMVSSPMNTTATI